jgi:hypothetical protein
MLEHLARLGYASKAVIYAIIGILAILTAANRGGEVTDMNGALRVVLGLPLGRIMLVVLAIGLCGYGTWRLLDAFSDPDRDGTTAGGLVTRIGNVARGFVYGAVGIEAVRLLMRRRGSRRDQAELLAARIFDWPFGTVLVGIVGAIVAAYGVSEVLNGIRGTYGAKLDWSPIARRLRPAIRRVSRFGVAVRGGLLATLGVFLVRAALTHDPNQAAGPRESMLRLGGVFNGRWFLALIAAGLLAYAVDQAVHVRCRRIRPVV